MSIILDLAVIAIIVLSIVSGIRKGFVKTVVGLVTFALSAVIAFTLCGPLANTLKGTGIEAGVESGVDSVVGTVVEDTIDGTAQEKDGADLLASIDFEDIANKINSTFKNANVDAENLETEALQSKDSSSKGIKGVIVNTIKDKVVPAVTDFVCKAICFIAIFILAIFALKLVAKLLDVVAKLPILRLANKVLGAGIGAVYGVVKVFILCVIINALAYLLNISWLSPEICDSTFLFNFFANFNPLSLF